jgi:hypothetical protein
MKQLPRKRSGDAFTPRDYNVLAAEVERLGKLTVVGAQFANIDDPAGPRIVFATSGGTRLAKSSGSIAAMSGSNMTQGTCTWYGGTGTLLQNPVGTVYPYNALGTIVGSSKRCVLVWDDGGSRWLVVGAEC